MKWKKYNCQPTCNQLNVDCSCIILQRNINCRTCTKQTLPLTRECWAAALATHKHYVMCNCLNGYDIHSTLFLRVRHLWYSLSVFLGQVWQFKRKLNGTSDRSSLVLVCDFLWLMNWGWLYMIISKSNLYRDIFKHSTWEFLIVTLS